MSSEIFRNPTEGASARRQDLLRRRRDEFVMMPHAIRRVYVARRARSGAAIAVWLTGIALIACELSPKLTAYVTRGMPGINPALLSTIVMGMWVLGIVAYFVARARCEHHFAVAISKTVLPGEDLDHDVERLANERPDDVARGMAHKLEVRSAAWPVAAASVLLPVTGLYLVQGIKAHGWPSIANFESSLARHGSHLAIIAAVGVIAAVFMMRRALRLPAMGPIGLAITVGVGITALATLPWLGALTGITAAITYIAFRLKRERTQLETDDPAAGSEILTWRDVVDSARSAVRTVTSKINTRKRKVVVAAMAAGALFMVFGTRKHAEPKANAAVVNVTPQTPAVIVNKEGAKFDVAPIGDGAFKIDFTTADDHGVDVPLPGIAMVPRSWNARVAIQLLGPQLDDNVYATPFRAIDGAQEMQQISGTTPTQFSRAACGDELVPLVLHISAPAGTHYSLRVTPVLEPAGC
ncbi:MAG TPA: hypothetical protein VL326_13365 [Kofleriaceae bacterium]|nr:hypothetical protein [Kofleriaceae bacterium]